MWQSLRGVFWVMVYVVVALAPVLVARLSGVRPGQGFVTDLSVALGFAALTIMVLQFGLVARFSRVSAPFGIDALIQYHRQIGFVALVLAIAHPALVIVNDPTKLALLDFPHAPNRARFAVSSVAALLLLIATSVWRKRLRLRYETWQLLHGLLAVAVVGLAIAHMFGVGYYSASRWQRGLWLALGATLTGVIAWIRVIKPLRLMRRAWRVAEVRRERGDAWTVLLKAEGHDGLRFIPGQFGWLFVEQSPFAVSAHPFSFSSSAEKHDEVCMTIKARGDFTARIAELTPNTRAYVDGPYGSFSSDEHEGFGFVLIGGGVGITPLMSMLRTMADREDTRPCMLIYGSRDWDSVIFREELAELEKKLRLTVVHVLERSHAAWSGETGFIGAALLERHLPKRFERFRYFVCGPVPMMDAMEHALVAVGVPDERVHTERFDMV
jgi:predicted ferric reductase